MNPLQWIMTRLIRGYQLFLSPLKNAIFGASGRCRFTPTCSQYALEAIQIHGAFKGAWLGVRRLLRCNPWGSWGPDPVPCKIDKKGDSAGKAQGVDDSRPGNPGSESSRRAAALDSELSTLNCSQPLN